MPRGSCWSEGLTKETSPLVAEVARKISLALGGKPKSEEHKKKKLAGLQKAWQTTSGLRNISPESFQEAEDGESIE